MERQWICDDGQRIIFRIFVSASKPSESNVVSGISEVHVFPRFRPLVHPLIGSNWVTSQEGFLSPTTILHLTLIDTHKDQWLMDIQQTERRHPLRTPQELLLSSPTNAHLTGLTEYDNTSLIRPGVASLREA